MQRMEPNISHPAVLRCGISNRLMTAGGQWHALPRCSIAVRFTPVSGIDSRSQALPGRAARNTLRHGLSLPVYSNPGLSEEVETLAHQIAGANANAEIRLLAHQVAEAQIDLGRVRYARHQLLSQALSNPHYDSHANMRQRLVLVRRVLGRNPPDISLRAFEKLVTSTPEGAPETRNNPFGGGQTVSPAIDRFDHAPTQVLRIRLRHPYWPPPSSELESYSRRHGNPRFSLFGKSSKAADDVRGGEREAPGDRAHGREPPCRSVVGQRTVFCRQFRACQRSHGGGRMILGKPTSQRLDSFLPLRSGPLV
jgi:hypothetical protein